MESSFLTENYVTPQKLIACGDVLKAAGWKAPVKNGAAYNLREDMELLRSLTPAQLAHGGYLYKDTAKAHRAACIKAQEDSSA